MYPDSAAPNMSSTLVPAVLPPASFAGQRMHYTERGQLVGCFDQSHWRRRRVRFMSGDPLIFFSFFADLRSPNALSVRS